MAPNPLKVVICGGGVIGCSIAYHLTQIATPERDVDVLVIECVDIACAASGKAGGFLAYDWCGGSALGDLAKKSFKLHGELASKLGSEYGYRKLDTLSVKASAKNKENGTLAKGSPEWLDGPGVLRGRTHGILGSTETTAQVHPYHFTKALIEAAQRTQKAKVQIGKVVSIAYKEGTNTIVGVTLSNGDVIAADAVIIAMGPWSGHIQLVPGDRRGLPVSGSRAHSIVLQPSKPVTPHAIFLDYKTASGMTSDPEIYPRPDGQVYVCGMTDDEVLPTNPADARPGEGKCEALLEVAKTVSSFLDVAKPLVQQACYLPVSKDGHPIIGKIPIGDYNGSKVYAATGHSCWGILNSPATGLAVAELVLNGASTTVDISSFDPARFFK